MFFAAQAIPALGTTVGRLLWVLRADGKLEREAFFRSVTGFDMLSHVLALAVGVGLFLGAERLSRLWVRSRSTAD